MLSAAGLYAASLGGWVFLFVVFGTSACPAQQTLISLTLLFCLGLTALSCSKIAPHGTLLTSAWVTAYCTFLCYSALASYPKGECNPMAGGGGWDLVLAVLLHCCGRRAVERGRCHHVMRQRRQMAVVLYHVTKAFRVRYCLELS